VSRAPRFGGDRRNTMGPDFEAVGDISGVGEREDYKIVTREGA
jgi:hypothetical protein